MLTEKKLAVTIKVPNAFLDLPKIEEPDILGLQGELLHLQIMGENPARQLEIQNELKAWAAIFSLDDDEEDDAG